MIDNVNPNPETFGDILALFLHRHHSEKDTIEIWNNRGVTLYRVPSTMPHWFLIDGLLRRKMIRASDTVYRRHAGKIEIVRAP